MTEAQPDYEVSASDAARLELDVLRERVAALEADNARLRAQNESMIAAFNAIGGTLQLVKTAVERVK